MSQQNNNDPLNNPNNPNNQNFNQNNQNFNQNNPNFNNQFGGNMPPYNQKSKIAAGLLGIFLGSLGVHNFYLGFTGKAIAQLLISVLSCGILAIVSSIWGLIEGIIILSSPVSYDAKGFPLSN